VSRRSDERGWAGPRARWGGRRDQRDERPGVAQSGAGAGRRYERLLEATSAHHVCVSIVGIDELAPFSSYYRVKVAQEEAVRESGRPFTIVRATQLHDFVGGPLRRVAKAGLQLRSRARLQPVDGGEVAVVIASVAEGAPRQGTVTVAGPEILTITEMRVRAGFPVPLPMPPGLGRRLRAGAATIADPDVRGTIAYREWLTQS
jgi:uncharacterized protein YbjT (DUF2867 family)